MTTTDDLALELAAEGIQPPGWTTEETRARLRDMYAQGVE